jgi:hypothetical protein
MPICLRPGTTRICPSSGRVEQALPSGARLRPSPGEASSASRPPQSGFGVSAIDRWFIACARANRVLDPVDQTAALWEHWERSEIRWMPGGHVTSSMSGDSWAFSLEALRRTAQLDAD